VFIFGFGSLPDRVAGIALHRRAERTLKRIEYMLSRWLQVVSPLIGEALVPAPGDFAESDYEKACGGGLRQCLMRDEGFDEG
jgi:hypothetical protein